MSGRDARVRVLQVAYSDAIWGTEQTILRLAPLLRARGVDVALAGRAGGDLERAWLELGLEFVPVDVPARAGLRRADGSGRRPPPRAFARESATVAIAARRLARAARAAGADVLHAHSLSSHLDTALAARTTGRRALLQLHDLVAPGIGRVVLGGAVRVAGRLVAISAACAECVPARARGRVEVVHHGVDLERFAPGPVDARVRADLGAAPEVPLVGIVGRVDPRKQVDVVVRAVAQLPASLQARLVVVGASQLAPPEYVAGLRRLAHELLGERVRFVGARADVPDVLRALDVLVNASVAEPFGLTLVEAQACGIPVVATRSGGAPEIVDDGVTGRLVPPGDPGGLAGVLTGLLGDPARRREMGRHARRHAERDHDIERQADRMVAIYGELASRPPRRRARVTNDRSSRAFFR
jgi:glycosyltransferase involved in cell wall biosynthesis